MSQARNPRRFKVVSLTRLAPNLLTLMALSAGLTAIRFAVQGRWEMAVWAILLAGVIDGLDGRIARLLKATSRFGAELDSLSDFISFGVAPAMVLYLWSLEAAKSIGWAIAVLFAVGCALRLARFNTQMLGEPDLPPWAYRFFTGVPAPAGAALSLLPMVLSFEVGLGVFDQPILVGPYLLLIGGLMVSRLPTFSFKKVKVPRRWALPLMLLIGLAAAFLVTNPWLTLAALGLAYLATFPVAWRSYRRTVAGALPETEEAGEEPEPGEEWPGEHDPDHRR